MNNGLKQSQSQKQTYKMSQSQLQAIKFLSLSTSDLREEIYHEVNNNPALEITFDPMSSDKNYSYVKSYGIEKSNNYEKFLENQQEEGETLQHHLLSQINLLNLSEDEFELCQRLIYNLDKNGCYGSMQDPKTLLNPAKIRQNSKMLEQCIHLIQSLDPIGTCCKTPEESLLVQAQVRGDANKLTLYILDGHLDFLSPPEPSKILKKLISEQKKFGNFGVLKDIKLNIQVVETSLNYILSLNPRPAGQYISDPSSFNREMPDVVLTVSKVQGFLEQDNFEFAQITGTKDYYFQVKYASGVLPEIQIVPSMKMDKENIQKANVFLNSLQYRKNSIILQGCALVSEQKEFFLKGPSHIKPLTHRKLANILGIHESTVSRMASRKNSKYIQTDWGTFPMSYFFSSAVGSNKEFSSQEIMQRIQKILEDNPHEKLSDNKITEILLEDGIKIARRTVAKYRANVGLKNSYKR